MGKRKRKLGKRVSRDVPVREVETTPTRYSGFCPTNLHEAKELFFSQGVVPRFIFRGHGHRTQRRMVASSRARISMDLLPEAKYILEKVRDKYGDGKQFMDLAYGPRIDYVTATDIVTDYLRESHLEEQIDVYWAPDLNCSARMMWHGPNQRYNRPEARRYKLFLNSTEENSLLRETGIRCLCHHEIGTHFMRMVNDGLQPWYSGRGRFGLEENNARAVVATEEGLAAINTAMYAKSRLLYAPALLYYTACMAQHMGFTELFHHLAQFSPDPDQRWKHVSRVKRGERDPQKPGGLGSDQCYFEGAVELLREADLVDLTVLYSGRLSLEESRRVKRVARQDCLKLPEFIKDQIRYRRGLRHMAITNGLIKTTQDKLSQSKKTTKVKSLCKTGGSGRSTPASRGGKPGRASDVSSRVTQSRESNLSNSTSSSSTSSNLSHLPITESLSSNINNSSQDPVRRASLHSSSSPSTPDVHESGRVKVPDCDVDSCTANTDSSGASTPVSQTVIHKCCRDEGMTPTKHSLDGAAGLPQTCSLDAAQGDTELAYSCDGTDTASEVGDAMSVDMAMSWRAPPSARGRLLHRPRTSHNNITTG